MNLDEKFAKDFANAMKKDPNVFGNILNGVMGVGKSLGKAVFSNLLGGLL